VTRMATLAPHGRIDEATVKDEISRLERLWAHAADEALADRALIEVLGQDRVAALDLFDRAQLATVVAVCRKSGSISSAGRSLFAVSRLQKTSGNDADRLRKYLSRFDLKFEDLARS